jgi:L-aspartate oxidase
VWLDMRDVDPERFPNVVATLTEAGVDPAREPVPVAPAAHYLVGGVATDLNGRTSVAGLLAVGECACTGLHGANRLASNSLSECFVFGARAAAAAAAERPGGGEIPVPTDRFEPPSVETRAALWRHAGPRRDAAGLERLLDDPYPLARMIAAAALAREESRGAHRRADFPRPDAALDGIHFVSGPAAELRRERWA